MSLSITHENFDEWMMSVCAPAPFIPVQGEGSRPQDQQGKEYINFAGGVAVNALGHAHPTLREALNDQAGKFWRTGNGYTDEPILRLVKKLIDTTLAERIFFCNSDAEANEAVLKLAHKYAHDHFGNQKSGIVAFKNAFHGRMLFIVSAEGQPAYSQGFTLLPPDIRHAAYNDPDPASQLIDDTTCAVIVEPVQGGGGVISATKAFLQRLRELCDHHNALLTFDEVQTGVGRTGELYAHMHYGMTPDLLMTAKALGGGFPIGVLLAAERYASVMTVGIHGTTYGRNPLAAMVTGRLPETVNTPEVLNGVKQRHDRLAKRINTINKRSKLFNEICGLGLLIGYALDAELTGKAKLILQEAAVAGAMVLIAGASVVRFAPALNVNEEKVATGLDHFALACERIKTRGLS